MNKSEIADRAAREIWTLMNGGSPILGDEIDTAEVRQISAIVERAIAESQALQPDDITMDEAMGIAQGLEDVAQGRTKPFSQIQQELAGASIRKDDGHTTDACNTRTFGQSEWTEEELRNFAAKSAERQPEPTKDLIRAMSAELGDGEPSPPPYSFDIASDEEIARRATGAVQEVSPREPTKLITTQAQEEARIFKEDNIKMYSELERAEAEVWELREAAQNLINADGHAMNCNFAGCSCGRVEQYKAARTELMRLLARERH